VSRRTLVGAGLLALVVSVLVSVVGWLSLEPGAKVPIHIGPDGVDRWVGRMEAAVSVPVVMALVLAVGVIRASRVRAGARARESLLVAASLAVLVLVHALVMSGSLGAPELTPALLSLGCAALLVALALVRQRRPAGPGAAAALIGPAAALVVVSPVLGARGVAGVVALGLASAGAVAAVSKRRRRSVDGA
jgi:hypothetical protein